MKTENGRYVIAEGIANMIKKEQKDQSDSPLFKIPIKAQEEIKSYHGEGFRICSVYLGVFNL